MSVTMRGAAVAAPSRVAWEAGNWVVFMEGDQFWRKQLFNAADRAVAIGKVATGQSPSEVLGWGAQKLPVTKVRAVEWVPAVATVLVRRSPWRDPWRLPFDDPATGELLFKMLTGLLSHAGAPVEARIGPNDLAMDPKFGFGIFLAFMGLVAMVGGAIEGVGNAPLTGPSRKFKIFAEIGEVLGVGTVIAIGGMAVAAGVAALVWWYRRRPTKWVVRAVGRRQ